jgi:hypothetical protein
MFLRQDWIYNIIEKLSFLKTKVELSTPLNLTDTNVISENFYRDFLNLVLGLKLDNMNKIVPNSAAIDLGDEDNSICIQVTSTSTTVKTRKTVTKFIEKKLHKKFKRLVILNITKKSNHQEIKIGDPKEYEIDTKKDIWDVSTLLTEIQDIKDDDKLKEISDFLNKWIKFESEHTVAKEIITFTGLIACLSDEAQPAAGGGFLDKPDPDGKVYKRFESHATFLTREYQDLYVEYGLVLKDVLQQSDMGQARIRRLGLHLKMESDALLTEAKDDPRAALELLTQRYEDLLKKRGSQFDRTAIKFFLLDQLIKCNVFPNKVNEHD